MENPCKASEESHRLSKRSQFACGRSVRLRCCEGRSRAFSWVLLHGYGDTWPAGSERHANDSRKLAFWGVEKARMRTAFDNLGIWAAGGLSAACFLFHLGNRFVIVYEVGREVLVGIGHRYF